MHFIVTFTFEPDKRNEIIQRRLETGPAVPEGMKLHGEWVAVGGSKVFRLIEADDPTAMMGATLAWSDLGTTEVTPVMDAEEVMKVIASR